MNTNPATTDQVLQFFTLCFKRMGLADQDRIKDAIKDKNHPVWALFDKAAQTLVNVVLTILSVVSSRKYLGTSGKKTEDCFKKRGKVEFYYRDSLDCFPADQPDQPESDVTTLKLVTPATFKEMAEDVIGKGDIQKLSTGIKERGYCVTLPFIDGLIERTENGEETDLLTNGYSNFFFVENKDGTVSVVDVRRGGVGQWGVDVSSLGRSSEWDAERRFFLRNFKDSRSL